MSAASSTLHSEHARWSGPDSAKRRGSSESSAFVTRWWCPWLRAQDTIHGTVRAKLPPGIATGQLFTVHYAQPVASLPAWSVSFDLLQVRHVTHHASAACAHVLCVLPPPPRAGC